MSALAVLAAYLTGAVLYWFATPTAYIAARMFGRMRRYYVMVALWPVVVVAFMLDCAWRFFAQDVAQHGRRP